MKERINGLRNESSKTKRIGLFQRMTAALLLPLIIIYKKVSSTFLLNLSLFWHINEGIEEIMADYVHQEMTRNLILVYLRLFLLIVIKDVFLSLVFFSEQIEEPNGSNSNIKASVISIKEKNSPMSTVRNRSESYPLFLGFCNQKPGNLPSPNGKKFSRHSLGLKSSIY